LGLIFGILFAVVVLGFGGWWVFLTRQATRLESEIARGKAEMVTLKAVIAEGQRFKQEKEELERRLATIDQLAQGQTRPVYLMDAMVDSMPQDLWLTLVEEKQNQLKLAGAAFSTTAVADLMANLRRSGRFKDVDILVSRQDTSKVPRLITFEVICRFEP
jgi:type IV pilus assembly protein PilN